MNSYTEKVSKCCSATLDWCGNYGDYYAICSSCKKGSWPHGVDYYYKYFPSDFEKSLDKRIQMLEARIALLEIKK